MPEGILGPRLDDDVLGLVEAGLRLVMVDAEALVIIDVVGAAAAEPDDEPPLRQMVDDCELLGEADRVVQRGLQDREAERGALQRDRQCAGKGDRIGVGADAVEMMLAEPDDIDAEPVGQHRLAQGLVDDDAVTRRVAAVGKQKIAEFHAAPPFRFCHDGPEVITLSSHGPRR